MAEPLRYINLQLVTTTLDAHRRRVPIEPRIDLNLATKGEAIRVAHLTETELLTLMQKGAGILLALGGERLLAEQKKH